MGNIFELWIFVYYVLRAWILFKHLFYLAFPDTSPVGEMSPDSLVPDGFLDI
jgi:hypothetical protein